MSEIRVHDDLIARADGSDVGTADDVFVHKYHLEPSWLEAASVIVDLGSNAGYTLVDFASRHPDARVYGVEPVKENQDIALRNIARFRGRVSCDQLAIDAQSGWVEIDVPCWNGAKISNRTATGAVRALSVDDYLGSYGLLRRDAVDFVKMDIEGAERHVLKAGGEWPDAARAIGVEVHDGYSTDECAADLRALGYDHVEQSPHHEHGVWAWR